MFRKSNLAQWLRRGIVIYLIGMIAWPTGSISTASNYFAPAALVGPNLSINVLAQRHPISPDIYGMNFYGTVPADYLGLSQDVRLPVDRWGGNVTTRYNWQTNSFNSGLDYFFEGNPNTGNNPALGQPSESDEFVTRDRTTNTKSIITIPLIGYVSKNRSDHLCGFSVAKYGPQQATDLPFAPDCGNGNHPDGSPITGNNPLDSSIVVDPSFMTAWINHLISLFNTAANGGVKFYQLDNEPSDWFETHRDVHPGRLTYDELRDRTYLYAPAIKQADPTAKTLGPSNFGWAVYADSLVPGDKAAHGNIGFSEWYLQQMRTYEQQHGVRILDYLDQHYYPAQPGVTLAPAGDAATQQLRLRSTRSLWDPTYSDESWISLSGFPPIQILPVFRNWINANYPGTKIAITEYNWGGLESMNGALAQADVLGIFGREQVDLATLWEPPSRTQPGAYAFRMYRNYDGVGSTFGDTWFQSSSTDQGKLAIYGAQRTSDKALTLMIINKTPDDLTSQVSLSGATFGSAAKVYRYSATNLNAIVAQPDQSVTASGFSATYPANSITLVVIPTITNIYIVKSGSDNGTFQTDTLSKALQQATAGSEIIFQLLPSGTTTINVTGPLPAAQPGVYIHANCNAGQPSITINGAGVVANVYGLTLSDYDSVFGLKITNFKRSQIKTGGKGNHLDCVIASNH